ncbi:hypothetical protein L226DRAFT_489969 [Lentinus tigrinus ALCF2SS1-7]|uniref:BTB domain-containing protein n=1 Tax=Lentinus tigrinus ALCF2SS1-6 TaxID=1328759 RepID=A0A5C2S4M5_9APHY|nr:hypothetical protein L227DRAFT_576907 [Lentinus tigrinus ALCF2SS1-6]RPD72843.1 hypothetical protein L226DRAFT_489969 [Lentinus tigrinus ALCF2SS1-7]
MSSPDPNTPSAGGIKRAREDQSTGSEALESLHRKKRFSQDRPRRDHEFWFDDGSIALVAKDVEFRVYKRVLSEHSVVFADMLSFPQPSSQQPTSIPQDCPIVHLDDSPEDLRHIFRAIFPRKGATFIPLELGDPTFDMVSAYARLGHKYQIDDLLDQSLRWLKTQFTTNFNTWIKQGLYPFHDEAEYAIGVVNIARLTQCHTILPTAMMICCSLPGETLVRGFERPDGSLEKLGEDDLILCIAKKTALTGATVTSLLSAFDPDDDGFHAVGDSDCIQGLLRLLHQYRRDPGLIVGNSPFPSVDYYFDDYDHMAVCEDCAHHLHSRLREEQEMLWCRLPEIFGLGRIEGWPVGPA